MPKLTHRHKMTTLNIRLDPGILVKIDKIAKQEKQTRSQVIRDAIQITFDRLGKI